jgi:hypothetical protein
MGLSYRGTLALASQQNFPTPSLRDYHYRVKNLDEKLLKVLIEESSKVFFRGEARVKHYIGLCHRVWLWREISKVEMLRSILKGFDRFERVPFIAV